MSDTPTNNDPLKSSLPEDITSQQELSQLDTLKSAACQEVVPDITTEDTQKSAVCREDMPRPAAENDDRADVGTMHSSAMMQGDVAEAETVHRPIIGNEALPKDIAELETVHRPAFSNQELQNNRAEAETSQRRAMSGRSEAPDDVADVETVHNPVVGGNRASQDIAKVETVHSPAVSNESVLGDVAEVETVHRPAVSEDVTLVETVHRPAVSEERQLPGDVAEVETRHSPAISDESEAPLRGCAIYRATCIPINIRRGAIYRASTKGDNQRGPNKYPRALPIKWPQSRSLRIILVIALLIPTLSVLVSVVGTVSIYSCAHGGMQHLLQVRKILLEAHASGFLDENRLHLAQEELAKAHDSFQQLHGMLKQEIFAGVINMLPQQATSIEALSVIGMDIADMGRDVTKAALILAPSFRGSLLTDVRRPLVTPATLTLIGATIELLLPRLDDIQVQARSFSPDALPMSAAQGQQVQRLLQAIPQVRADLTQGRNLLDAIGWMLGVSEQRTFLIETMDRAELRPTGGFTGQFGELLLKNGRIAPFALKNIGPYEENNPQSLSNGKLAPPPFRTWWPIPNWGLRDSNLSADFPTSARLASAAYEYEFKQKVDGVMLFSPFLIARVLQITGPIAIPAYHESVTAQNLEERLHYYQLDNAGIRKEEIVEHLKDPIQARKLFTASVARTLMDTVRHVPPDALMKIGSELFRDLKTRDLQVYVENKKIESLLEKMGAAAEIDRSLEHDGLYVVQANLSANKASQYVRTLLHDVVTLDASGGATHHLQMQLSYNQIGPVYGLDTYRDYIRIYVPPTSRYLWGDGFDTGRPLCGGILAACTPDGVYPRQELACPRGQYQAGAATSMLNDPYMGRYHPLDHVGAPTNFVSDEPGRAMFAGWVIVPKNCTATVTLSWYVPALGHASYGLLIQRQSSTFPALDLTILPTLQDCGKLNVAGRHFNGIMDGQDMFFAITPFHFKEREEGEGKCYSQLQA